MAPDIEYLTAGVHWLDATVDPESVIVQLIAVRRGVPTSPGASQGLRDPTERRALASGSHRESSVSAFLSMVTLILLLALPLAGLAILLRSNIGDWAKERWEQIVGSEEAVSR